jgi:hypothetical protein
MKKKPLGFLKPIDLASFVYAAVVFTTVWKHTFKKS